MMSFAALWAFVLLPLPVLVSWFAPPYREKSNAIRIPFFRHVAQAAGVEPRSGSVIPTRTRFQTAMVILIWLLLITALARPEKLGEPVVIEKSARDGRRWRLIYPGRWISGISRPPMVHPNNGWPPSKMSCATLSPIVRVTAWP